MSVDTLRETFHINTIGTDALDDFLTAQTYRKDITKAYEIVKSLNWEYLQDLSASRISQGPTPVYGKVGVACLKSKHTSDLITDIPNDEQDLVDDVWAHEKDAFKVQAGDLVITRKGSGTIGRVSVFFEKVRRNTDDSLFKVTVDKADPCYVASFLRSFTGERLLEKGVYGSTGQLSLSSMHIRKLPIYTPDLVAQAYIGNKVRQAELLREWTGSLEENISNVFSFLTFEKPVQRKSWKVESDVVNSFRLNPKQYDPVVLGVINQAKKKGIELSPLSSLIGGRKIAGGATPKGANYPSEGVLFARVQNVKPYRLDLSDAVFIDMETDKELSRSRCEENDILLAITGYPGSTSLIEKDDLPVNTNQHSVRFNVKGNVVDAAYVVAAMNSEFVELQVNQLAIGATRDALDYPSVGKLLIPILTNDLQNKISNWLKLANGAVKNSQKLTQAAKYLVEALIEGHITEAELITAQQSLEEGDNSKDRAILSKLTDKGYLAEGGKPLFPDLDKLYELLEEAQQAKDAEQDGDEGAQA